ncbi:MAG: cell division FtsA domain-containing protein, partial [Planctomycetes bacterium]|nr:cell division FtsA domain-containing protein [Planctomycetota bacterium]
VRANHGDGPLRLALAAAPGLGSPAKRGGGQLDPLIIEACRARCEALVTMGEAWAFARAEGAARGALVISIGALNTELTAVLAREPRPEDSSVIRCGGADVDAKLVDLLKDRAEAPRIEAEAARRLKETHGRIRSRAGGVLVRLPVPGGEAEMDIGDELQRACGQILVGLRSALRRTTEQLNPQERLAIKGQVILAGGSAQIEGLCEALQPVLRELSAGSARRAAEPEFAAARGALAIAQALPERRWQEALSAA